jgi:hypothetical protein
MHHTTQQKCQVMQQLSKNNTTDHSLKEKLDMVTMKLLTYIQMVQKKEYREETFA